MDEDRIPMDESERTEEVREDMEERQTYNEQAPNNTKEECDNLKIKVNEVLSEIIQKLRESDHTKRSKISRGGTSRKIAKILKILNTYVYNTTDNFEELHGIVLRSLLQNVMSQR